MIFTLFLKKKNRPLLALEQQQQPTTISCFFILGFSCRGHLASAILRVCSHLLLFFIWRTLHADILFVLFNKEKKPGRRITLYVVL
jgi:hypothetical protein